MKWFSVNGIITEVKRIRWSSPSELASKSGKVIFFCLLFAIFFMACEGVVSSLLKLIGVGA